MKSGIPPMGTSRPISDYKSGRIGRPVQTSITATKQKLPEKFIPIENIQEKLKMIAMIGNPQYIELSYIIGIIISTSY